MKNIDFRNVKITDGFWHKKQNMIKDTSIDSVYNRFVETFRFEALKCTWKEGEVNQPHIFWDSDVAKWIEGVAYSMHIYGRDEHLEKIIDECVDLIEKNSDENGYFNSHFLVTRQNERFRHRTEHELYCLGHLIEAAIAYNETTGKDKFLKQMCKYADVVERIIYNGFLSGVSMDGKSFFYENPLEIDPDFNNVDASANEHKQRFPITERVEVFTCSCCPPNVVRFIPSIANFTYTLGDDTLYVQQYMTSEAEFEGNLISQNTNYPADGEIEINYKGNNDVAKYTAKIICL